MECKLLFVLFAWHFKNKQNVKCVAEPQESQALLCILSVWLNHNSHKHCFVSLVCGWTTTVTSIALYP
jgi:hypothetical protein